MYVYTLLVTEDDILTTLEEIYEDEKESKEYKTDDEEKYHLKKSKLIRDKKILVSEIDNVTAQDEEFSNFKQLTKRKHTVIDSEKQIVSGLVIKTILIQYYKFISNYLFIDIFITKYRKVLKKSALIHLNAEKLRLLKKIF